MSEVQPTESAPTEAALAKTAQDEMLRRDVFTSPEAIGAAVIMGLLTMAPLVAGMPLFGLLFTMAIGLGLLALTLISGDHILTVLTVMYAGVVCIAVYLSMTDNASDPPWGVMIPVGVVLLVLFDLIRVSHARRRQAEVSNELLGPSILGPLSAGLLSVVSAVIVWLVGQEGEGVSWLWTPVAVGVVLALGAVLIVVPRLGSSEPDRKRWTPGDSIPPGPRRR